MSTDFISDQKKLAELLKKFNNAPMECMHPGCHEVAIKSHVLQNNGILDKISTRGHLYEIRPFNIWDFRKKDELNYQKLSTSKAFTFPGFCNAHDNEIFSKIEKKNIDFRDSHSIALFCYRGLCQEIRRKEQVLTFLTSVLKKNDELSHFNFGYEAEVYAEGLDIGISNLNFFKRRIEKETHGNSKLLTFKVFELPYFEICTSTVLNIKDERSIEFKNSKQYRKNVRKHKLPCTYINLFPFDGKLILIIGEDKNYRTKFFARICEFTKNNEHIKLLNELYLHRSEYWAMSFSFYDKFIEPMKSQIKDYFLSNVLDHELEVDLPFEVIR